MENNERTSIFNSGVFEGLRNAHRSPPTELQTLKVVRLFDDWQHDTEDKELYTYICDHWKDDPKKRETLTDKIKRLWQQITKKFRMGTRPPMEKIFARFGRTTQT